jgi:hypothetical protein
MKVRITQTIEIDDDYRRAINQYYGREGLASREQVRDWIKQYGSSMDDDLALSMDQLHRIELKEGRSTYGVGWPD